MYKFYEVPKSLRDFNSKYFYWDSLGRPGRINVQIKKMYKDLRMCGYTGVESRGVITRFLSYNQIVSIRKAVEL